MRHRRNLKARLVEIGYSILVLRTASLLTRLQKQDGPMGIPQKSMVYLPSFAFAVCLECPRDKKKSPACDDVQFLTKLTYGLSLTMDGKRDVSGITEASCVSDHRFQSKGKENNMHTKPYSLGKVHSLAAVVDLLVAFCALLHKACAALRSYPPSHSQNNSQSCSQAQFSNATLL